MFELVRTTYILAPFRVAIIHLGTRRREATRCDAKSRAGDRSLPVTRPQAVASDSDVVQDVLSCILTLDSLPDLFTADHLTDWI